jgi:GNAT superfamily N-acetyltransferase
MLTTQVENWSVLEREAQEIFKVHYDELALHKEAMPMGLDGSIYLELERLGRLLVITARKSGTLVGYYMAIFIPKHPHNKDAGPVSTTDFFYILPEHRRGGAGAKLLSASLSELRRRGVTVASISIKYARELATGKRTWKLIESLGGEATDIVFQFVLKERLG